MFFNLIIIAENRLEWKGFRLEEFSCIVQESWCRLNTHSAERLFKYDYPINMKENPIVEYFKSAWEEFGKITWPTKEQAALLTGVKKAWFFVDGVSRSRTSLLAFFRAFFSLRVEKFSAFMSWALEPRDLIRDSTFGL